jgi:virginiamycin B lyase
MGSRDTTPGPDGTIWFCGQRNGTLGRLDPATAPTKLVDLGKGARPMALSSALMARPG